MAAEALSCTIPDTVPVTLLRVSAPNWMPSGANNRGTRETLSVIAEHVAMHEKTILCVDEIDKLIDHNGDTSWKTYIRGELFDLVDGRWPTGLTLPESDDEKPDITIEQLTTKLEGGVFILGIGTFQGWFDDSQSRRTIGFGPEINPRNDVISADIIAEKLPRELANRFNASLIRILELRIEDYHRIALETESKLPQRMQEAFRAEVERRIPGAIAAKKGVRFLEEALLEVLIKLPPEPDRAEKPSKIITEITSCTLS